MPADGSEQVCVRGLKTDLCEDVSTGHRELRIQSDLHNDDFEEIEKSILKFTWRGAQLPQSVERTTLDIRVMGSSSTPGLSRLLK